MPVADCPENVLKVRDGRTKKSFLGAYSNAIFSIYPLLVGAASKESWLGINAEIGAPTTPGRSSKSGAELKHCGRLAIRRERRRRARLGQLQSRVEAPAMRFSGRCKNGG